MPEIGTIDGAKKIGCGTGIKDCGGSWVGGSSWEYLAVLSEYAARVINM